MSDLISPVPSDSVSPSETAPAALASAGAQPCPQVAWRLRLWPGVVIIVLQWLVIRIPGWVAPDTMAQFFGVFLGPIIGGILLLGWWLFASRIRHTERWLLLLACAATGGAAYFFYDPSFQEIGLMGMAIYVLPVLTTAWVGWLLLTTPLRWPIRRVGLLLVFLLVWGYFDLVRFHGVTGSFSPEFQYRWTPTAEAKLLAALAARPAGQAVSRASDSELTVLQPRDWPGFRGPARNGQLTGFRLAADWDRNPPRLVWRRPVGPGWSSFAVVGTRLYTQEQRGQDELVVCYDTNSGAELWVHREPVRFTEVIGGPGPRATPTFHDGKLYALGATGRLNCFAPADGRVLWSRDIVADSGAEVPKWGFASSPLVVQDVVMVFAGAPEGKSVLGYNALSGERVWSAGEGKLSYCSPQLARLAGVEQVLLATELGLTAFDPVDGNILWKHSWPIEQMARIVQPALVGDADVLIGTGLGIGTRRISVHREGDAWTDKEVWTSRAIKPYYNDLVVHGDALYGFDGSFFTCVSLKDGKARWRERGYGNGQVLLLADQGLLLVLAEQGEVALLEANPDERKELGRFQAINGKTWNHPVIAHGKLFVRNGEEAACFQLTEDLGTGGR